MPLLCVQQWPAPADLCFCADGIGREYTPIPLPVASTQELLTEQRIMNQNCRSDPNPFIVALHHGKSLHFWNWSTITADVSTIYLILCGMCLIVSSYENDFRETAIFTWASSPDVAFSFSLWLFALCSGIIAKQLMWFCVMWSGKLLEHAYYGPLRTRGFVFFFFFCLEISWAVLRGQ